MAIVLNSLIADFNAEIQRIRWLALANGDTGGGGVTGTLTELGNYSDRTVQVTGTFGAGGSVSIQGSNDGGTTWATLTDPQGVALTFTAAGLRQILELPFQIRPNVTAGDGTTSLNVYMMMRKDAR